MKKILMVLMTLLLCSVSAFASLEIHKFDGRVATLRWDVIGGATGYMVTRNAKTQDANNWNSKDDGTKVIYTTPTLKANSVYNIVVVPYTSTGLDWTKATNSVTIAANVDAQPQRIIGVTSLTAPFPKTLYTITPATGETFVVKSIKIGGEATRSLTSVEIAGSVKDYFTRYFYFSYLQEYYQYNYLVCDQDETLNLQILGGDGGDHTYVIEYWNLPYGE